MPRPKKQAPEAQAEAPVIEMFFVMEDVRESKPEPKKAEPVTVERLKAFSVRELGGEYAVWSETTGARVSPLGPSVHEALALLRGLAR